jgi:alkanesulfonate monooxygenase SsuD/methylene tetrahydromethanopterin reductase-like flavin-dependent oxidoreductase (luciferase family)
MRFGYLTLGENRHPGVARDDHAYYREYVALAEELDRLEYSSIWTGEHHFAHVASVSSPMVLLSAIAARTERIRVGTAVNVLSFHHPIRLAEDYATLDVISGGRACLGAGTGYAIGEFKGFGVDVNEARARMRDTLAIANKALQTGSFGIEGTYHTVPEVNLVPAPVQNPFPVYVAVTGSWSTVEWTDQEGHQLMTSSQSQALTGRNLGQTVREFRRISDEHGHHDSTVTVPYFMICSNDPAQVEAEFTTMTDYWRHFSGDLDKGLPEDLRYWEGIKDKFAELTVEDLHNRQCAFGTPEKLVEMFLEVAATGVDELLIEPFYGAQSLQEAVRNAQLFRERVMPYVDDRFGGPKYRWDGNDVVLERPASNVLARAAVGV